LFKLVLKTRFLYWLKAYYSQLKANKKRPLSKLKGRETSTWCRSLILQTLSAGFSTVPTLRGLLWVHRAVLFPTLDEIDKNILASLNKGVKWGISRPRCLKLPYDLPLLLAIVAKLMLNIC
jgi:hypothetical protein